MPILSDWLTSLGLEQYVATFVENEVDFETLKVLTESDLKELGLPFGPRKKILNALGALQPAAAPAPTGPTGERRQLTALFCDMVAFTELAQRVDPEVLQTIVHKYEEVCTACVTRYDGHVYQCQGDGVVAFFGYPTAHEGEAGRAIRAGLDIIEALARLDIPDAGRLMVRIGIASGIVVVAAGERGAVGETINLASRLQSVASPGEILVSDRVRRLTGGEFEYADLGEFALKGIKQPTRVFHVLGVSAAESRFDAATRQELTPLVGRAYEIGVLLELLRSLQLRGSGHAVLLMGEPGIGKSRTASALREHIENQGVTPLRLQCSPFYANSPFYPAIAAFERALDFGADEPAGSRLDKLETLVMGRYGRPREDVRFIAAILSIPFEDRYGPIDMTPQLLKNESIRVLVDIVRSTASKSPNLLLVEDIHWADPTTLSVLDLLVSKLGNVPLLVVLTARPEFANRWGESENTTVLTLGRLTPAQSRSLASGQAGGKLLPDGLVDQIVAKADGIPLFVEELTKSVLESGDLRDAGDRYVYAREFSTISLPETLRDSLMARLDRVATVRSVAQIGSAIGREFSYALVAALQELVEPDLSDALARLTASGLASCHGETPNSTYTFKHALVQDAAYDSLLKSQRRVLHEKIARALQELWPETEETEPELLAHHTTEAGAAHAAVRFWRLAGELAMQRFALPEANTHLRKGLALLESLPENRDRDLMELEIRTALCPAVVAMFGWGHNEISRILEPAWALAKTLGRHASYVPILNALWVHNLSIDHLDASLRWADKMLDGGADDQEQTLEIVGRRAISASKFWLGEFIEAREQGDLLERMYDPLKHRGIVQLTNTDPLTGEGIYRAQYLWMLGYPDQARAASDAKDAHARQRNHPFDLAFALTLGAQAFDFLCEPEELLKRTEEAERVGRKYGVALLSEILADISRGIVKLRAGRFAESAPQLETAIDRLMATGHRVWIWYLRALQADAMSQTGALGAAHALVDECVARTEAGEQRAHYAEILRIAAVLRMRQGDFAAAEASLRRAIDVARAQHAKSWELRASTTLADLFAQQRDLDAAREALSPVYGWFTEGFATRDLIDAKALLAKLDA